MLWEYVLIENDLKYLYNMINQEIAVNYDDVYIFTLNFNNSTI